MPEAAEFLSGFGFTSGAQFDGYRLSSATSTHETIKRYQEYRYNIKLVFINLGNGTYETLYPLIADKIFQEHIIYGIRNPYRCIIDPPKMGDIVEDDNKTITFNLMGHSYRMYNK